VSEDKKHEQDSEKNLSQDLKNPLYWQADIKDRFKTLPLEDQLRLLQELISNMEFQHLHSQGSKTTQAASSLKSAKASTESTPLQDAQKIKPSEGSQRRSPFISSEEKNEAWEEMDSQLDAIFRNKDEAHPVHKQRLEDAAARYKALLKRYGHIKGSPSLQELALAARKQSLNTLDVPLEKPDWAEWVAKDQETLDLPQSHAWIDYLFPDDDDYETKNP